jgi:TonB-linked SusC/RagA family outer membrane protein
MCIQAFARYAPLLLALFSASTPMMAQQTIAGVVTDPSGRPLNGAQILLEGSEIGTLADQDGRFRIMGLTGAEATLRIVLLGYRTEIRDVRVGDQDIRIVLESAPINLDELVVTGTAGGAQRRAVANSVARVQADEIVTHAPVLSVDQLLNGRAPGVVVSPPTGSAGGGSRLLIRGRSSISLPTGPLIYIDGVRVDNRQAHGTYPAPETSRLNDVDPESIESIEVIKGPAAATLYGTEASNGVIQIITRKGRPGPTRIGVSITQGAAWFHDPEGRWIINYYRDPGTNEVIRFNLAQEETERGTPLFRTGHNQGYAVNVSGGTDAVQYFAAASYDRDEGVTRKNVSERFGGRLNLTLATSERWDANAQLGVSLLRSNLPSWWHMRSTFLNLPATRDTPQRGFARAPTEIEEAVADLTEKVTRITPGVEVRHYPNAWLMQRLRVGVDVSEARFSDLTRRMTPEQAAFFSAATAQGAKTTTSTHVLNNTIDYSATGTSRLSRNLTSMTTVGVQYYRRLTSILGATGSAFPSPNVTSLSGAARSVGMDDEIENVTLGVFGQQQFSWNEWLYLTAAIRADDNSAFGADFDFVTYPKISASWLVSEAPFWSLPWVDKFRVRVAWGKSGQQPEAYAALRTFAPITTQGDTPGVTPQFVGNPKLGPEKSTETEVGFDASLLADRLAVEFTYFRQRTEDAIILRDVAPSSGFPSQQFVNAGEVRNRGIELVLDARLVERETLDWDAAFSVSTVDNEVISLGIGGIDYLEFGGGSRFIPGYPVYSMFARKVVSAEWGPGGEPINILCDGGRGPYSEKPGGSPVDCATAPRVFAGKPDPGMEGAFSTSLRLWDRVTLSGLVDFKLGQSAYTSSLYCPDNYSGCEEEFYPERFDPVIVASTTLGLLDDHRWIRDRSFWKFRELSVSYLLPPAWLAWMGASAGSISVAGRNLHTWTSFEGLDPENATLFPESGILTVVPRPFEQNEIPQLMQFMMKVNLTL